MTERHYHFRRPIIRFIAFSWVALLVGGGLANAAELPKFAKVDALIQRHFEIIGGHRPGDLISQTQVAPIFGQLEVLGWEVADKAAIYNSVLPDANYVVHQLRTPEGMKFMRKVAGDRLAYDRLDQISRMPGGKLMIKDFIRFPNADLSFTNGSAVPLSRYARFAPSSDGRRITAADLNKPTGRIYTMEQLIARLKTSYDAEVKRRKKSM